MSRSKQQGFTLLEMMIAFSLLATLFVALFSSFYNLSRAWEAVDRRILATSDQRLVSEFLRNQLSQAMVVRLQTKEGYRFSFDGAKDYVRYAAPLQPLQQQGGIYLIELKVVKSREEQSLEMRYAPYRPDQNWEDALSQVEAVPVYQGLAELRFSYYAAASSEEEPTWEDEWLDKPVYPLLVKVSLQGKDKQVWPELIVDLPQVDAYAGG